MRTLRWPGGPLLAYVVAGALLFRAVHGVGPATALTHPQAAEPIVVSAEDVARLRADYTRETGLEANPADESALIDKLIDEELLFREALARGLDRNDRSVRTWLIEQMSVLAETPVTDEDTLYARALALGLDRTDLVVRRILVQKMKLLAARANELPPDDDTLRAYYAAHTGDYAPPARVSLWQVFLSSATHGEQLEADAVALLGELCAQALAPPAAARRGEAFPVGPHLQSIAPSQVEKLFGAAFAAAILRADTGTWTGPVPSAYGLHLVWMEGREPSVPPPFDAVRGRVRERWQDEQRRARLARLLHDLGRRHPLHVASSAWRPRSGR